MCFESGAEHRDELKTKQRLHPRHHGPAFLEQVRSRIVERELFPLRRVLRARHHAQQYTARVAAWRGKPATGGARRSPIRPSSRMIMNAWHRLSYAWRSLQRAPLFSVTVVLALTIGIGSSAAIFAIVNGVLLRPLPYGHPDRLVGAWHDLAPISLMHAQQTAGTFRTYKQF